jgi:DNA-directed RNA polymerase specialized sigma24 family protein
MIPFSPWRLGASADDHERIFVERLSRVMHWARQIAGGDASLAEDLAQDAFLHFTAGRPALEEISNIDKYLYVVLKNLFRSHLAAVSRRCAVPFDPLAHETATQTWRSVDPEQRLTLRQELHRICIFVCDRKETSKGASAFLLHFFHGLSVADVRAVMQTTRAAVDERLSVVRKEVRRHLERRTPVLLRHGSGEMELMAELQSIIAVSCRGECFSAEEAQRAYALGASELSRDRLAHLASCSKCLGLVAELLEFRTPSGGPPSASAEGNRLARWKRKRADLLLTEPSELRLIVNGHLLATERVHRPDNDLSVSIALHEPLDFVEIWSSETTRLLLMPGISEPPEGKYDQRASIDLRAGTLQVALQFTDPWPRAALSYTVRSSENPVQASEYSRTPLVDSLQQKITPRRRFSWSLSIPTLSTAIALALIVVLLFVQTRDTTLGAAELLDRAGKWEKAATTGQSPVLHRRFSLVKHEKGMPAQRTFVDVWRRAGLDVKLSRWTDVSGRVLGEARVLLAGSMHVEQGNIWQFEPSADAFMSAVGPLDHASVVSSAERTTIRASFAELVLDRATNRPIEEKFTLDTSAYVFTEASTETIPLAGSPLLASAPEARPAEKRMRTSNAARRLEAQAPSPDLKVDERELQVRRELHDLGLATAASINVHDNTIDVQFAPTSAEQERALTDAIERIPGVNVSILSARDAVLHAVTEGARMSATPATGKVGEPLASKWLKPRLGSESEVHAEEERRLGAARLAVGLVAEWRLLAERYPAGTEAHSSAQAESILRAMLGDLRTRVRREVENENVAITELLRNTSDSPGSPGAELSCETWQSQAVRGADLLWENERAIEQFYGPAPTHGATMRDADLLQRLRSLTQNLTSLLRLSCD